MSAPIGLSRLHFEPVEKKQFFTIGFFALEIPTQRVLMPRGEGSIDRIKRDKGESD